jgi:FemAB-related protein (PEP-CTERM system-associated)
MAAFSTETRPAATPATTICVRAPEDHEYSQWDRYVLDHPHASPFHLTAWKKTIEEAFGYRPYYLAAFDTEIRGLLPLFLVRNPIIGKALISAPFAVYGGILADDARVRSLLYEHAKELGQRLNVDYIEFRNGWPEQSGGPPNVSRYVTFSQPVEPDEAALLAALPKKTRNLVRKALKEPLQMRYGVSETQILDRIHARNMLRLGTPNFPRRYFDRLLENFKDMADVREVWLDNTPVAVSLNIYFRDSMHTYHAAADTRYNSRGPNTFMYYDHLRWAGAHGYKVFDFGRCKRDTGVFQFKKHWNTTVRELPYEIVLVKRKEPPNFSPANRKFALFIRMWQMLPLPLARILSRKLLPMFP